MELQEKNSVLIKYTEKVHILLCGVLKVSRTNHSNRHIGCHLFSMSKNKTKQNKTKNKLKNRLNPTSSSYKC